MERRETQADSHVIIICLMMCAGEQGESAIEIRAGKIQKSRFHFSVGLLKMQHPSFVEMLLKNTHTHTPFPAQASIQGTFCIRGACNLLWELYY